MGINYSKNNISLSIDINDKLPSLQYGKEIARGENGVVYDIEQSNLEKWIDDNHFDI